MYVYIYMYMGTKTISIIDEAYNALKMEKEKDESFSDIIIRLTKNRSKLKESFGKWNVSDEEIKDIKNELKKSLKRFGKNEVS